MSVIRNCFWIATSITALGAAGCAWRDWWFLALWLAGGTATGLLLLHTVLRSNP